MSIRVLVIERPRRVLRDVVERPASRMLSLVGLVGVLGGLVGAAYLGLLQLFDRALGPDHWSRLPHLVVLVAVGAGVAALTRALGRPSGVELLVDNIHVDGGARDVKSLRSLIPVSLLCVGAGGALGPEAPLVTTTGTIGSWVGRRAGYERERLRIVAIAGMAAGFTVLFGAPLGSAVFALEILHRRGLEYYEALLPALIGSVCGYAVYAAVTGLGLEPIFQFPAMPAMHLADLGWGAAAGVAGAVVAVVFTYLSVAMRRVAGWVPHQIRPAVGGLVLGGLAFVSPYALTNGEVHIEHLTEVQVAAATLLLAAGVKVVASAVTLVCGWPGGFIIPLFFIGFCLAQALAPHLPGADPWMLAAAMMVACNVGVTKTPVGTTLVVTEMAGMALLPATLLAALVSLVLTSNINVIHTQRQRLDTVRPEDR